MSVFSDIYRENRWHGRESRSGPGSGLEPTRHVAAAILGLTRELGVRSVLDVGCGDGLWMPDLPGYVGIDVAAEAVHRARQRHPDRDYRMAAVEDIHEPFDLVICRDAIQHLSLMHGQELLGAIRDTGSRWLLASTFVGGDNRDIRTGDAYSPDLTAPPFRLAQPARLIFDGYGYDDGSAIRDPRKHLGLWAL